MYGLFPVDSYETKQTAQQIIEVFDQPERTALPRYEHDTYRKTTDRSNYWHVTSLWFAQYYIEIGKLTQATKIIAWCLEHSYESGVMAEQINPYTGESIAPAPLAWSHAEYLTTLLDLYRRNDG